MFIDLNTKKIGTYLIFLMLFFCYILIEYNIKDDFIMNYNLRRVNNELIYLKSSQFEFEEFKTKKLMNLLESTDSLSVLLENKWYNYIINVSNKKKYNQIIQHNYIKTQRDINFIQLMITTEINKRKFYRIKNTLHKFKN